MLYSFGMDAQHGTSCICCLIERVRAELEAAHPALSNPRQFHVIIRIRGEDTSLLSVKEILEEWADSNLRGLPTSEHSNDDRMWVS